MNFASSDIRSAWGKLAIWLSEAVCEQQGEPASLQLRCERGAKWCVWAQRSTRFVPGASVTCVQLTGAHRTGVAVRPGECAFGLIFRCSGHEIRSHHRSRGGEQMRKKLILGAIAAALALPASAFAIHDPNVPAGVCANSEAAVGIPSITAG